VLDLTALAGTGGGLLAGALRDRGLRCSGPVLRVVVLRLRRCPICR
jgi:hypothetical protein